MCERFIPSPVEAARTKVEHIYTGPLNSPVAEAMMKCDAKGPLMIYVTKLYSKPDCSSFDALGRVFSGTIKHGEKVKVLGEGYSIDDEEDMALKEVSTVWLYEARYRIPVNR